MRAVKKVIVLLTAVVLGCACLFTVGCGNEELLQKIDSLAEKVETLEGENASLTEQLGELQTENEELAGKIGDLEAEQEQQKFETANLNMIVFDRWPRHGGQRGCCIIFNHPDPTITFECTVNKGTVCTWDDYSQDPYKQTMSCQPGDRISWIPNERNYGYDFIDIVIKQGKFVIGYAVIDIVYMMEYDDERILIGWGHAPSILAIEKPIYIKGNYTSNNSEQTAKFLMASAKESVMERNAKIDEIFRKHFEYYDKQKEN